MSQRDVQRVIGRLVTDEAFRHRFSEDPGAVLQEVTDCGLELTALERQALASIHPAHAERFADMIDPRIQKVRVDREGCS